MHFHMLSQITLLSKTLATNITKIRLDSIMHPAMVKKVSSSKELLSAPFGATFINDLFPSRLRSDSLGSVRKFL